MVNYEFLPQPANSKVLILQIILHFARRAAACRAIALAQRAIQTPHSIQCHLTKIHAPSQPAKHVACGNKLSPLLFCAICSSKGA